MYSLYKAIYGFFGLVAFQFTLEEAIGRCLVEYDYYVHPVYLTETEMDEWFNLTGKIKQNAWRSEDAKPDEYLAKLLRDRRALLETASGKVSMLRKLLDNEDTSDLRHTLVYPGFGATPSSAAAPASASAWRGPFNRQFASRQ